MKFKTLLLLIFLFLNGSLIYAQNQVASQDVGFRISLVDGKTVYRTGEPITLVLSYTSDKPGYAVETYYSPLFDDVFITPTEGLYPWLYRVNRLYSYDDVIVRKPLSAAPVIINLTVNNLVRFDHPGKYKVKVATRRVWGGSAEPGTGRKPSPILSNELEFEIKEMSSPEEQAEVEKITQLMDSAKTLPQYQKFKLQFDYLTGDISTAEKVRRFLKPPVFGGVGWLDSGIGLNIARNKKLAVELLEAAFRDPTREIHENLIGEIIHLRLMMEDEAQPSQAKNYYELGKERAPRIAELQKQYDAELLESLPRRTESNKILTSYRIFTALSKDDTSSAAFITTKPIVMAAFDNLPHYQQSTLLDRYWDKIKTPALIPSLVKILSTPEPVPNWSNRPNALKRLIELDQKLARPFVVAEMGNFLSGINVDILAALDAEYLPEADMALLAAIKQAAPLKTKNRDYQILYTKNLLAARYATAKIYKELMEVYKSSEKGWLEDSRGALLAYFTKHNAAEGIRLIDERISKLGEEADSNIFYSITKMGFPQGLEKYLQKRLATDIPGAVDNAAYRLAKYGGKKNRKLIEEHHARWLQEWKERGAELDDPKTDRKIRRQSMVQINLIESLINAKSWKLSEMEIKQLKLACITQHCRQFFSIRYLNSVK
jgi:hypothetical protein